MNRNRAVATTVVILVFAFAGLLALKFASTKPITTAGNQPAQVAPSPTPVSASAQQAESRESASGIGSTVATQQIQSGVTQTGSRAPAPQASAPEITNLEPETVLEIVRSTIRNYGQRFGGNPVGTNLEITRALGGENAGQVNFLGADDGLRVNARGELIDVWGTPFFFHQLSGTEMEIHSAGPDKIMWTTDDLVTR